MRPSSVLIPCLLVAGLFHSVAAEGLDDLSLEESDQPTSEDDVDDLSRLEDFMGEEEDVRAGEVSADKAGLMLRLLGAVLKRPGMTRRFGQILPILRVMSPPQRLALAALIMQQAMVPRDIPEQPLQAAMRLGGGNLTTQLLLPLSADIASMFRGAGLEHAAHAAHSQHAQGRSNVFRTQQQVPRWRSPPSPVGPPLGRRPPPGGPPQGPLSRRRECRPPESTEGMPWWPSARANACCRPPAVPSGALPVSPHTPRDRTDQHACNLFSDTVCASVDHYPEEDILASIHADKHTLDALLADSTPVPVQAPHQPKREAHRRQDDDDYPPGHEGYSDSGAGADVPLCPSIIKYARPQRARATSGQWKYIVNTAEHTQTLRLEKCTRVDEQCSYVSGKLRSHCAQVYNYHRLLTWDKEQGLHMDIFKVPTCCSCQVNPSLSLQSLINRQQQGEYSDIHETVVLAENGRAVHPNQQTTKPNQAESGSSGGSSSSSRPVWPFRKAATRRPPLQQLHPSGKPYGLQALDEQDLLPPQYPPLPLQNEYEYPPLAGRRTTSVRNRTRITSSSVPDDLLAEGSERRPVPLSPVSIRPTTSLPPAVSPVSSGGASTASPKRINYSYHPIIDFFRPLEKHAAAQESRHARPAVQSYPSQGHAGHAGQAGHAGPGRPPKPQAAALEQRDLPQGVGAWSPVQSDWSPITRTVTPSA